MNQSDQITALEAEMDKLIDRFAEEFDMPVASIVGVLALKQHELMENNLEEEELV